MRRRSLTTLACKDPNRAVVTWRLSCGTEVCFGSIFHQFMHDVWTSGMTISGAKTAIRMPGITIIGMVCDSDGRHAEARGFVGIVYYRILLLVLRRLRHPSLCSSERPLGSNGLRSAGLWCTSWSVCSDPQPSWFFRQGFWQLFLTLTPLRLLDGRRFCPSVSLTDQLRESNFERRRMMPWSWNAGACWKPWRSYVSGYMGGIFT